MQRLCVAATVASLLKHALAERVSEHSTVRQRRRLPPAALPRRGVGMNPSVDAWRLESSGVDAIGRPCQLRYVCWRRCGLALRWGLRRALASVSYDATKHCKYHDLIRNHKGNMASYGGTIAN